MPKIDFAIVFHAGLLVALMVSFFLTMGFPLLGTIGFESANLLVTVFGPLFCLAAALHRRQNFALILRNEMLWLTSYVTIFFGMLLVNGFYLTSCSQGAGLLPFLIIAIPPLLLNVSLGAIVAALLSRTLVKFLVITIGYIAYYATIIFSWWHETTFRIFTHASFIMSSDLVNGDQLSPGVVGYRASTLLLALVVILAGFNFLKPKSRLFGSRAKRPIFGLTMIAAMFFAHLLIDIESLSLLGKNRTALLHDYQLLAEQDGLRIFGDPLKITIKDAQIMLDEARFYKQKITKYLGELSKAPITIWLHASHEDEFLYTGAKNVHFALPKHREIHISGISSPHRVLGHELAHIYVGEFSSTIFGLPGSALIVPNLAMTEGVAMALSKELNITNDLSLIEQAQALHQAGLSVDVEELFSINPVHFLKAHPHVSYIYAGAMIDFLLHDIPEAERVAKLRSMIAQGSLSGLYGDEANTASKKAAFLTKLNAEIRPDAIWWAKKYFLGTSILSSDCSSSGDTNHLQWQRALFNQDTNKAKEVLRLFPAKDQSAMLNRAIDEALKKSAFAMALELITTKESLETTEGPGVREESRFKKLASLIGLNRLTEASIVLNLIDDRYFPLDQKRLLLAYRAFFHDYLEANDQALLSKSAITLLYVNQSNDPTKFTTFSYYLGQDQLKASPHNLETNLIGQYIYARFHMRHDHHLEALKIITDILQKKEYLPDLIERETQMMLVAVNTALGNKYAALTTLKHLLQSSKSEAETEQIKDKIERLQFIKKT